MAQLQPGHPTEPVSWNSEPRRSADGDPSGFLLRIFAPPRGGGAQRGCALLTPGPGGTFVVVFVSPKIIPTDNEHDISDPMDQGR